jgi:hypothetical protein
LHSLKQSRRARVGELSVAESSMAMSSWSCCRMHLTEPYIKGTACFVGSSSTKNNQSF